MSENPAELQLALDVLNVVISVLNETQFLFKYYMLFMLPPPVGFSVFNLVDSEDLSTSL